jgi:hypothetical protein
MALAAKDFASNGDIDGLDGTKGRANGAADILLKINILPSATLVAGAPTLARAVPVSLVGGTNSRLAA